MIKLVSLPLSEDEWTVVKSVFESKQLTQGPIVGDFEKSFAKLHQSKYGIATNSGTAALHTALLACGIGKGDEVITTPFSFIASANSILYCGARPVFSDINETTLNLDVKKIQNNITKKTKAILVVHLYGQPCDMNEICKLCEDNHLLLIEDCCQAHGAEYNEQKVGSFGDAGCFSFYATKNITTGEGGMVITNNDETARKSHKIINHGRSDEYVHDCIGYNYRMTDIAAAIGLKQIVKLDHIINTRISNAAIYSRYLRPYVRIPIPEDNVKHSYHQYTVMTDRRDLLKNFLEKAGIESKVYYPIPIHKQPFYKKLSKQSKLPVSERASMQVLSIPVHQDLTPDDIKFVASKIIEFNT